MSQDAQKSVFETLDGCAISYSLRPGSGAAASKRVVLIHSLALDASIWDRVAEKLAGHANILTYDCRGHGSSGNPSMSFTTELFARDLAGLLDHLGWRTAIVAGCSMGGCVAQAFAGLYPARVEALGLIDTTAWYGKNAPAQWGERAAAARAKGLGGLIEFQLTRWFSDGFRAAHPEVMKEMSAIFLANDLDCYAASCALLGDADLRPYSKALRVPVAIMVGEEDYATPVSASQDLHAAIQGSSLTILPGGRHLTPVECPKQVAEKILSLMQVSR